MPTYGYTYEHNNDYLWTYLLAYQYEHTYYDTQDHIVV